MVLTHAWSEGVGSYTYPGATGGVSFAHPSGTNTGPNQNATGGGTAPAADLGDGQRLVLQHCDRCRAVHAPSAAPAGTGYHVINVTSHVQQWVSGTNPNYGWVQVTGYWDFHLSEAGAALQPVLFVDYAAATRRPRPQ